MRILLTMLLLTACAHEPPPSPQTDDGTTTPAFLREALRVVPGRFDGTVTEIVPAGGYTYLHLRTGPDAEAWVVTLQRDLSTGDEVSVRPFGELEDFTSRRTGRTFARLQFALVTPGRT